MKKGSICSHPLLCVHTHRSSCPRSYSSSTPNTLPPPLPPCVQISATLPYDVTLTSSSISEFEKESRGNLFSSLLLQCRLASALLMSHKLNEKLLRFVFIGMCWDFRKRNVPAEVTSVRPRFIPSFLIFQWGLLFLPSDPCMFWGTEFIWAWCFKTQTWFWN